MTDVERIVREAIATRGPMSFARFMEAALYAPGIGYYSGDARPIGRDGDFYTSVSVGPMFGFLLAARFAGWIRHAGPEVVDLVDLVEAGAHDGRLMHDLLDALQRFHPDVASRVRGRILEPHAPREAAQRRELAAWAERVTWHADWTSCAAGLRGVIFANELLDAFPVHRLAWDAARRRWFEWGVTLSAAGDRLDWCRLEPSPGLVPVEWAPLEPVLPDGYIVERSPAAEAWWRDAASRLESGWLVAFDYGFDEASEFSAERRQGTARAYHRHRLVEDLLARPGEQDLTAHVDFPRLARLGESVGLRTVDLAVQGRWLDGVAVEVLRGGGPAADWLTGRAREWRTLAHPSHLGHAMRVLVQSRGSVPGRTGR